LADDAALIDGLVMTHDTIAEGVHFRPGDPPASVGWKLVAVNLSDLAAKGARPAGALLSLALSGNDEWDRGFLDGIAAACESYGCPLIGGDTIALPHGAPRVLGLTAIGRAGASVPARSGARPGDSLWLAGTVGDSAAGLALLGADSEASGILVDTYRRPVPLLGAGQALAPHATAMMDVSDGLLLDALRMAQASGCVAEIDLAHLPLSRAFIAERGQGRAARLFAATGGDDYALLAALPPGCDPLTLSLPSGTTIARIGAMTAGSPDVRLSDGVVPIPLPETLGHEHRGPVAAPVADRP
jgi:thiamine-monophosphate kinase